MKIEVSEAVFCEPLDDEVVLLDMTRGHYFGLDPVGARLFELLREGRTTEEVVDVVLEEYEVAREELTRDLRELVDALAAEGLLRIVET